MTMQAPGAAGNRYVATGTHIWAGDVGADMIAVRVLVDRIELG
ncbi:hypothetical protein ABGB07_32000 [Micromonosporaceae bacterium B7E4]